MCIFGVNFNPVLVGMADCVRAAKFSHDGEVGSIFWRIIHEFRFGI